MGEKENLVQLFDDLVRDHNKNLLNFNFFEESLQVIHSLKKQYDDQTNECKRLQNSLDAAHYKIVTLYSQLNEISGQYQELLKRHKESIIDNGKHQPETKSQFSESPRETSKDKIAESILSFEPSEPYIETGSDLNLFAQTTEDSNSQPDQYSVVDTVAKSATNENRTVAIIPNSQQNHDLVSTFFCEICGRYFARKGNLRQHQKIVHGQKNFKCSLCERTFHWKYQLNKHKKAPCNRKRYKCSNCNATFAYMGTKRRHEKIFHLEYSRFWCSFCNMAFSAKVSLNEHLKWYHPRKTLWKFDEKSSQSQCTAQSTQS